MTDISPTTGKRRVRISDIFREPDEVELPSGLVAEVRPLDAVGYDLYLQLNADPGPNARLIWDITARCLPSVSVKEVDTLTVPECTAVLAIAVGRIQLVQQLAAEMEGKEGAPTVAAPTTEHQRSATPPASSASESPAS